MNTAALESASLRVRAEQIADAYDQRPIGPGAPSLLGDTDKVQLLLASIRDGNYRETAIRQAGIAKQTFYNWLKRAETGDEGAKAFVDALEKAEADAEAETVKNVRNASKQPQFWAAGMTWLERKSPDKWGKRADDSTAPRVVVQIGVKDGDVQVTLAQPPAPLNIISNYQTQTNSEGQQPQQLTAPQISASEAKVVGRKVIASTPKASKRTRGKRAG